MAIEYGSSPQPHGMLSTRKVGGGAPDRAIPAGGDIVAAAPRRDAHRGRTSSRGSLPPRPAPAARLRSRRVAGGRRRDRAGPAPTSVRAARGRWRRRRRSRNRARSARRAAVSAVPSGSFALKGLPPPGDRRSGSAKTRSTAIRGIRPRSVETIEPRYGFRPRSGGGARIWSSSTRRTSMTCSAIRPTNMAPPCAGIGSSTRMIRVLKRQRQGPLPSTIPRSITGTIRPR